MSSWGLVYNTMATGLQRCSRDLTRLQEQVAFGAKIIRASDGPGSSFYIMDIQDQSRSLATYTKNLDRLVSDYEQASTALGGLSSSLIRVHELVGQAASGTYSGAQRAAMAGEVDSLLDWAVALANAQSLGRYLFAGESSAVAAYAVQRTDGKITTVTYQGAAVNTGVPVAPGVEQSGTIVGDSVFRSDDREAPVFFGNTGAKAGAGTSSVRGDVWLILEHDTTTYLGATGVAAGASSPKYDTILGTSHKLNIDADNALVWLDDGAAEAYDTGTDSNLRLENSAGDVVYVDMTGLDPGLSGTVEVSTTATGKMSIDELATTVDLTAFSDCEAVTHSTTERVLYVDATEIVRVGTEPVRVPGTYDIFGTLIGIRDLLTNERGLSETELTDQLSYAVDAIKEVTGGVTEGLTFVGARLQAMGTLQTSLVDMKGGLEAQRAALQDADIVAVAAELAQTQTYYEMMLATTARVLNLSLMNFLQ